MTYGKSWMFCSKCRSSSRVSSSSKSFFLTFREKIVKPICSISTENEEDNIFYQEAKKNEVLPKWVAKPNDFNTKVSELRFCQGCPQILRNGTCGCIKFKVSVSINCTNYGQVQIFRVCRYSWIPCLGRFPKGDLFKRILVIFIERI